MKREKIDSSAIRELGWDETGSEVQYHRTGCARTKRPQKRDGHGDPELPAPCDCEGGDVYHHAGVPAELHAAVISSMSIGQAFGRSIKAAKHPHTKELLYPHRKVTKP
jgi:hypothetical protein